MSELKCPFCQQEYIITKGDSCFGQQRCVCRNPNCEFDGWHFPIKLVSELIRTRKALDVAKDTFNWIDETYRTGQEMEAEIWGKVQLAAQEITALEQKDK